MAVESILTTTELRRASLAMNSIDYRIGEYIPNGMILLFPNMMRVSPDVDALLGDCIDLDGILTRLEAHPEIKIYQVSPVDGRITDEP